MPDGYRCILRTQSGGYWREVILTRDDLAVYGGLPDAILWDDSVFLLKCGEWWDMVIYEAATVHRVEREPGLLEPSAAPAAGERE